MVLKEKTSGIVKSTSELANHTNKSNLSLHIDLKVKNADDKNQKIRFFPSFPKHPQLLKSVKNYALDVVKRRIAYPGSLRIIIKAF